LIFRTDVSNIKKTWEKTNIKGTSEYHLLLLSFFLSTTAAVAAFFKQLHPDNGTSEIDANGTDGPRREENMLHEKKKGKMENFHLTHCSLCQDLC